MAEEKSRRYEPLSASRHAHWRLIPGGGYGFAAEHVLVPIVLAELPYALRAMPVAFTPAGSGYQLQAVLGLEPGQNVFTNARGQWRSGAYIPALLRAHPFRLLASGERREVIGVDPSSEQLTRDPYLGEPLFDAEGSPAPVLERRMALLRQVARSQAGTERAVQALAGEGVIEPWPITYPGEDGGKRRVQGLYQVRESTMQTLDGAAFERLRDAGALSLAYGQMFSRSHARRLVRWMRAKRRAEGLPAANEVFDPTPLEEQALDWDALDETSDDRSDERGDEHG
ncbi:SapC family protein [Halorhodospira sp. 9622]|uniref:SapC family protein n=1 Tax=Halorhodospira sp. 9622 TaxID=2899136 RepID=UPI001EE95B89|nr:SapC family protein [Halorhodospira sp. 9622]MCG5539510.1 SapC family protein [Halorhodospira sp. 9622]